MRKQLYRAAAATVLGLSLSTGVVAADTGNINNTGPGSSNNIHSHVRIKNKVHNTNTVTASNTSDQSAYSGDAKVKNNTTGGNAKTGDATNDNSTMADLTVTNTPPSHSSDWVGDPGGNSATIDHTGPGSSNDVSASFSSKSNVTNTNTVTVTNSSSQDATSGDATVSGNTTGGNATSGNASNTNSTSFTFNVSNN